MMLFAPSLRRASTRLSLAFLLLVPCASAQVVGEVYASDATVKGSVMLAAGGAQVMSGSSVTAGQAAAVLRLARGGEVRVCPGTSLSVSTSPSGKELMMGMSTGAVETHYKLGPAADTIMTPDFRILLAGPGDFHFALGADPRGNTCIRSLPSNTASVIVSELMGESSYQVRPGDQVSFRAGQLAQAEAGAAGCGCPPPPPPVLRAEAQMPAAEAAEEKVAPPPAPALALPPAADEQGMTAPPPAPVPGEVHIAVEAPFVFRWDDPGPPPPITAARLQVTASPVLPDPAALAPPAPPPTPVQQAAQPKKPRKRGFFGRIGRFFAALFGS